MTDSKEERLLAKIVSSLERIEKKLDPAKSKRESKESGVHKLRE